ncbi:hypothetical protein CONLIGDRAFT_678731 [Coniochaeta ligniaria NRRL 30616]|uniref:Uncharacterized protein n=1 Tax=Coniochaeta ligniaria NRRL 30616 TaxID=1408157 RepID=A0A1J7IYT6_9PEZI|nr:hypothetical protein CONLIGDRAFT_678731 [Coniochaeta ligniaria NRRL 30616]
MAGDDETRQISAILRSLDPILDVQDKDLTPVCEALEERRLSIIGPVTLNEESVLNVARTILDAAAELNTEIDKICSSASEGKVAAAKAILNGQKAPEDRLLVRLW